MSLRSDKFERNVLIVPIGFVADQREILYDLDIEAQAFARARGLTLKRTESLKTSPTFISALADIVRKRLNRRTATLQEINRASETLLAGNNKHLDLSLLGITRHDHYRLRLGS